MFCQWLQYPYLAAGLTLKREQKGKKRGRVFTFDRLTRDGGPYIIKSVKKQNQNDEAGLISECVKNEDLTLVLPYM